MCKYANVYRRYALEIWPEAISDRQVKMGRKTRFERQETRNATILNEAGLRSINKKVYATTMNTYVIYLIFYMMLS